MFKVKSLSLRRRRRRRHHRRCPLLAIVPNFLSFCWHGIRMCWNVCYAKAFMPIVIIRHIIADVVVVVDAR